MFLTTVKYLYFLTHLLSASATICLWNTLLGHNATIVFSAF